MVIIGAKGFAKEVLEIFSQRHELTNLFFFDNVSQDVPDKLYGQFPVLRTVDEVKKIFQSTGDNRFTLGLGNPVYRFRLNRMFTDAGGELVSTISPNTDIGTFGTSIAAGCNILSGTVITNDVTLKNRLSDQSGLYYFPRQCFRGFCSGISGRPDYREL